MQSFTKLTSGDDDLETVFVSRCLKMIYVSSSCSFTGYELVGKEMETCFSVFDIAIACFLTLLLVCEFKNEKKNARKAVPCLRVIFDRTPALR